MTARERALAQWRGTHLAPQELGRVLRARTPRDVLPTVLKDLGLDRRRSEAEIVKVWNHLIDPMITGHAQPVNLARGTLFVAVDSHVWLDEIVRYRRHEILERLQNAFGRDTIRKISWRVG